MMNRLQPMVSIKQRLNQASLVVVVIFVVVAVALFFASARVGNDIDRIVDERLPEAIEVSQFSRDFGLLLSRLGVLQNTFFGDESLLEAESGALQDRLGQLQRQAGDSRIGRLIAELKDRLDNYRQHAEWVNTLLDWRSGQDTDLDELLRVLQELLAERTVEVTLAGGEVDYLEQLVLLVSGYRESLLDIMRLNAMENRRALLESRVDDPPPLEKELRSLALRLRTLTASEPPLDRFGRHLISRIAYYQYLMRLYQLEMIQLNHQNLKLKFLTGQILDALQKLDKQTASAALVIKGEIKNTILTTRLFILALVIVLAVISWMMQRNLFSRHIRVPMEQVNRKLHRFQQGDVSPMQLGRKDEWAEIETTFNGMLAALTRGSDALKESEKRYRGIFTNATEGIFRSTPEGRFVELNPAGVKLLGFDSVDEVLNHYQDLGAQLYHDRSDREKMLKTLYAQGTSLNFETRMRRKNGELFWCSVNNYLIRNEAGTVLHIEGTLRDISARKVAQESLEQLRSYLQNIIDSMPSVLIGVDVGMRVTLWNKRAEQESILTAGQAMGSTMSQVCRLFNPAVYLPQLQETLTTRRPHRLRKMESLKFNAEGGKRYFDILIYPLSLGKDPGAVVYMEDVSERAQLENMMVRSEKMRSIGSLASGLAHEINNPLAAVMQNAQVLNQRLSRNLKKNAAVAAELGTTIETVADYAQRRGCLNMIQAITDAGQKAAKIVANLQSFSRVAASNYAKCSLVELFDRTLELASSDYDMRHHYDFRHIKIVREIETVPQISCESSQIQQVILSLLKNAAQAMSRNTDEPQITVGIYLYNDNQVALLIEDNGPGMDEQLASRIFDPFYTTNDVGLGTGLGLSIAYFIVTQNHRGEMNVTSQPGQGSCFKILLPVEQEDQTFVF